MPITEGIDVVRVLHGARDIEAIFTWRVTADLLPIRSVLGRGVGTVAVS